MEGLGHYLMNNHVHLVLLPHQSDAMAKALRHVHMRYSQYGTPWNADRAISGRVATIRARWNRSD